MRLHVQQLNDVLTIASTFIYIAIRYQPAISGSLCAISLYSFFQTAFANILNIRIRNKRVLQKQQQPNFIEFYC